jgi:hypothetical protein
MHRSFAPIIAAFLLLLPVLYVGSYLALVDRDGAVYREVRRLPSGNKYYGSAKLRHYRINCDLLASLYWPLEQLDRRVYPDAWPVVISPFYL